MHNALCMNLISGTLTLELGSIAVIAVRNHCNHYSRGGEMFVWLAGIIVLGIKKLVFYLLSVHAFLVCLVAMLVLLFILVLEFRKRNRASLYNLNVNFEASLTPAIWEAVSSLMPELREREEKLRKYKMGKMCWN